MSQPILTELPVTQALNSQSPATKAQRRIASFRKHHGEAHFWFACHAAFPVAVTPELLYGLWANFQRDERGNPLSVPWIAVADILCSGLWQGVGLEIYEVDPEVRNELLGYLREALEFGPPRILALSDFLAAATRSYLLSDDPDLRDFGQCHHWTALAYRYPEQAAQELVWAIAYAFQEDTQDLRRITELVESLAEPLEEFQDLLLYAKGMGKFAQGNLEAAHTSWQKLQLQQQGQNQANSGRLLIPGKLIPGKASAQPSIKRGAFLSLSTFGVVILACLIGYQVSTHPYFSNQKHTSVMVATDSDNSFSQRIGEFSQPKPPHSNNYSVKSETKIYHINKQASQHDEVSILIPEQSTTDNEIFPEAENRTCSELPEIPLEAKNITDLDLNSGFATVSEQVHFNEMLGYTFQAQAGDMLAWNATEVTCMWIFAPDASLVKDMKLPMTGKYIVQVSIPQSIASFALEIGLTSSSRASNTPSRNFIAHDLTQQEAVDLVNNWLSAKKRIFAPPWDTGLAEQYTTGLLLRDVTKPGGSIDFLQSNSSYYTYEYSRIFAVLAFTNIDPPALKGSLEEKRMLHEPNGINWTSSGIISDNYVYYFTKENGVWKIQDYVLSD
jgi:hypothetical protein